MDIINSINESKKRTTLMNNLSIDWQYSQQLIPKIINETKDIDDEFIKLAGVLHESLTNMENAIKELKSYIPNFENTNS